MATLNEQFPNSTKKLPGEGAYEIVGTKELREALRGLVTAYPPSHYGRTEIGRFNKRLEDGRVKVDFLRDQGQAEYVHVRHPLVLLSRWLSREPLPEVPYCRGVLSGKTDAPKILIWGAGSLEGYTNRAELLTAVVDCATREVTPNSVEEAQTLARSLSPVRSNVPPVDNLDDLMAEGEKTLLRQFDEAKRTFSERNALLTGKAKQAVNSHAERKLEWLRRQLSRNDLKDNIRNLYRGWSQRLQVETQAKLEEIEQKGRVKSSLQIVGIALVLPDA